MNFKEAKRHLKEIISQEDYDFYVDFYERMDEARNHKTFKPKSFDKFVWILKSAKNSIKFHVSPGSDHYRIKYDTTKQPVYYYPATQIVIYKGSVEKLHHWLFLYIYIIKLDKMHKKAIHAQNKKYEREIKKALMDRYLRKDKKITDLMTLLEQYGTRKLRRNSR